MVEQGFCKAHVAGSMPATGSGANMKKKKVSEKVIKLRYKKESFKNYKPPTNGRVYPKSGH